MTLIRNFLAEIDAKWKPLGDEPPTLRIIGSAAFMLQCDYERGTKDADVLEADDGPAGVETKLLSLAGKGTDIHKQFRMYADIVKPALLFLPQRPDFHLLENLPFKNFRIEALDVNDVILIRYKKSRVPAFVFHKDDSHKRSAGSEHDRRCSSRPRERTRNHNHPN